MRSLVAALRGIASVGLFGVFGAGAILLTPLMLILRTPERCQPLVRATWRLIAWLFVCTGLIKIDRGNLASVRGSVIAASHPSLIDVVLLVALVPRTLYVAKHGLRNNFFLSAIVRATALPDDARLPEAAAPFLSKGWNVLIFPEGTRSPREGGLNPLRRGAAQLALRCGAPLVAVRISLTRRLLAKRQAAWDMGSQRVTYAFSMASLEAEQRPGESCHAAACRLTEALGKALEGNR